MPIDHDLEDREALMLDVYGALLDADVHRNMLMLTVGYINAATDTLAAQTMYWRCDN